MIRVAVVAALVSSVAAITGAAILVVATGWHQIDWGTVPAWVSAAASTLTLFGIVVATLTFMNAQRDRRDDELNQARLITPSWSSPGLPFGITGGPYVVDVTITNNSTEPVFNVNVDAVACFPATPAKSDDDPIFGNLTPHFDLGQRMAPTNSLLDPNTRPDQLDQKASTAPTRWVGDYAEHPTGAEMTAVAYIPEFRFTDASGRRWRRIGSLTPERMAHPGEQTPPQSLRKLFGH